MLRLYNERGLSGVGCRAWGVGKNKERKTMKNYKDLIVYQKAYKLALEIYRITRKFPTEEMYGLTAQMRRAAVSMPSNIAEGYRRGSRKEYVQFLRIAFGSYGELETQISLSVDLKLLSKEDRDSIAGLVDDIGGLLTNLIRSLK